MGVFVITRDLDTGYLAKWAKQLGVADLLERAIKATDEQI